VDVVLRASVPRVVGQLQIGALETHAAPATFSARRLSWFMRLGGSCTRNANLNCPPGRGAVRRCQ
jgi:hypothetical protein